MSLYCSAIHPLIVNINFFHMNLFFFSPLDLFVFFLWTATRQSGGRPTWPVNCPSTTWRSRPFLAEQTAVWGTGRLITCSTCQRWGVRANPLNYDLCPPAGRWPKRVWRRRPVTSQRIWWASAAWWRSRCSRARRRWHHSVSEVSRKAKVKKKVF